MLLRAACIFVYRHYFYRWTEHCRAGGIIGRCAAMMSSARRRAEHSCHSWQRIKLQRVWSVFQCVPVAMPKKGGETYERGLFYVCVRTQDIPDTRQEPYKPVEKVFIFRRRYEFGVTIQIMNLADGRLRERTLCADHPNLCPKSPKLV
jgi:hypothetical protein